MGTEIILVGCIIAFIAFIVLTIIGGAMEGVTNSCFLGMAAALIIFFISLCAQGIYDRFHETSYYCSPIEISLVTQIIYSNITR